MAYEWTAWSDETEIVTELVTRPPSVTDGPVCIVSLRVTKSAVRRVLAGALIMYLIRAPLLLILRWAPRDSCP